MEVSEGLYRELQRIAEALGFSSVKALLVQELKGALANAEVWLERAKAN
jgi:hypothetical protein